MDADWHAFCQATYEGSEWEELYYHCRDMREAAEANKPNESQKAKALWAMKPRTGERISMIGFAKTKFFWKKSDSTRAVERAPQRHYCSIGQGSEVFGEPLSRLIVGSRLFVKLAFNGLVPKMWDKPVGRCLAPF